MSNLNIVLFVLVIVSFSAWVNVTSTAVLRKLVLGRKSLDLVTLNILDIRDGRLKLVNLYPTISDGKSTGVYVTCNIPQTVSALE